MVFRLSAGLIEGGGVDVLLDECTSSVFGY